MNDLNDKINNLEPMGTKEMNKIEKQIIDRWKSKPWYFDPNDPEFGSPNCLMKADEVLRLIKRATIVDNPPRTGIAKSKI